jgi:hypothetical protein
MAKKGFYLFKDPLGTNAVKQGITGSWEPRLGVYQNSYSRKSHTACFNAVWVGGDTAINELEKVVKREYNRDIEMSGWGHSEWIDNHSLELIEAKVDEIIKGYCYKIVKVDQKFLPLTIDNMPEFKQHYGLK